LGKNKMVYGRKGYIVRDVKIPGGTEVEDVE